MTPEETVLWRALRRNSIADLHFRRQQIIAGFIADFYSATARLVVEIDGASRLARKEYDSYRDDVFSELGIRTLRFSSESVRCNPMMFCGSSRERPAKEHSPMIFLLAPRHDMSLGCKRIAQVR
jgi:very-short-patch-repair endonuclease